MTIWLTFFPAKWAPADSMTPSLWHLWCKNPTQVPKYGSSHSFVHRYLKNLFMIAVIQRIATKTVAGASVIQNLVSSTTDLEMFEEASARAVHCALSQAGCSLHSSYVCQHVCQGLPLRAYWLGQFLRLSWVLLTGSFLRHADNKVLANTFHSE